MYKNTNKYKLKAIGSRQSNKIIKASTDKVTKVEIINSWTMELTEES